MFLRAFLLFTLTAAPLLAQAEKGQETEVKPPSLVELARQERERRQKITQPVRLITNRDLHRLSHARVTTSRNPSGSTLLPDKVEVVEKSAVAESPTREELAAAFAEARLNYQNAVSNNLVLQLRINNLRNAFATADDGSRNGLIQAQLQEAAQRLGESQEQIDQARQVIADLEVEAAEAGLLPGEIKALVGQLPTAASMLPESSSTP